MPLMNTDDALKATVLVPRGGGSGASTWCWVPASVRLVLPASACFSTCSGHREPGRGTSQPHARKQTGTRGCANMHATTSVAGATTSACTRLNETESLFFSFMVYINLVALEDGNATYAVAWTPLDVFASSKFIHIF